MIFNDKVNFTTNLSNPAPCCGATNESREHWPAIDVLILIDIVEKQNLDDYKERKVAIVFVSTLLEMLLEETLNRLVSQYVNSNQAAEALMDSFQGRQKRIALFNKLSGMKLKELLYVAGFNRFLNEWEAISYLRNKVVHRGFHGLSDIDINATITNLLNSCIDVFTLLNNEVTKLK